MLKNSKVVLCLSPLKAGQAGNFWTLLRTLMNTSVARVTMAAVDSNRKQR